MTLAGAVINQAIFDFKHARHLAGLEKCDRRKYWHEAKEFLFTNQLENYITRMGLEGLVDPQSIRRKAKEGLMLQEDAYTPCQTQSETSGVASPNESGNPDYTLSPSEKTVSYTNA